MGYINFANPQGEFIGVERLSDRTDHTDHTDRTDHTLSINERSQRLADAQLYVYATDQAGDRLRSACLCSIRLAIWDS